MSSNDVLVSCAKLKAAIIITCRSVSYCKLCGRPQNDISCLQFNLFAWTLLCLLTYIYCCLILFALLFCPRLMSSNDVLVSCAKLKAAIIITCRSVSYCKLCGRPQNDISCLQFNLFAWTLLCLLTYIYCCLILFALLFCPRLKQICSHYGCMSNLVYNTL
jgi:hypothetical protein